MLLLHITYRATERNQLGKSRNDKTKKAVSLPTWQAAPCWIWAKSTDAKNHKTIKMYSGPACRHRLCKPMDHLCGEVLAPSALTQEADADTK
jgi:hypothetical protein